MHATPCCLRNFFCHFAEGPHAYDFSPARPEDHSSVGAARSQGANLIGQWVAEYNTAKTTVPLSNAADLFQLSYNLGGYIKLVNYTLNGSASFTNQSMLKASSNYSNGPDAV